MRAVPSWVLVALFACQGSSGEGSPNDAAAPSDGNHVDAGSERDARREADRADSKGHDVVDAGETPGALVAYASGYGPDIHRFSVDPKTGILSPSSSVAAFGTSPSFLAVNPSANRLYAVDENTPGRVGAYTVDPDGGALTFLGAVSSGGDGPPFVGVDATGKFVFVANYGDGSVSVLPVSTDGSLGDSVDTESVGAEAHMILADPTNHFVFVPCKGADYVAQFLFDATTGKLTPNAVPHVDTATGAGPRHISFHPNGRFAYLINETNSTMTLYDFDASKGTLAEVQTVSTIPPSFSGTNTAAEVHVHASGAWVVGSNRGDDSLVVFSLDASSGKMTLVGFTPSGGMTPRDFSFDPTGAWLYAANQGTGNVATFHFDASHGRLTPVGTPLPVASASFVGIVSLP